MKTIIAGSRSIEDLDHIYEEVAKSGFNITEVVCGGAKGADSLGKIWAEINNIPVKMFLPNWEKYGKSAGPIRNNEMAEYADAAIVLISDNSKGSRNMIDLMRQKGKPIHVRDFDSEAGYNVNEQGPYL